jgi:hypothetical protein
MCTFQQIVLRLLSKQMGEVCSTHVMHTTRAVYKESVKNFAECMNLVRICLSVFINTAVCINA